MSYHLIISSSSSLTQALLKRTFALANTVFLVIRFDSVKTAIFRQNECATYTPGYFFFAFHNSHTNTRSAFEMLNNSNTHWHSFSDGFSSVYRVLVFVCLCGCYCIPFANKDKHIIRRHALCAINYNLLIYAKQQMAAEVSLSANMMVLSFLPLLLVDAGLPREKKIRARNCVVRKHTFPDGGTGLPEMLRHIIHLTVERPTE